MCACIAERAEREGKRERDRRDVVEHVEGRGGAHSHHRSIGWCVVEYFS